MNRVRIAFVRALILPLLLAAQASGAGEHIKYPSSADGTMQPAYVQAASGRKRPLVVGLHSWSTDYKSATKRYSKPAQQRNWHLICPNFRGPNKTPQAMGSELVVRDILSAVHYMKSKYQVDPSRVYLVGVSGGGYAALLMAGRHPEVWTAVSSWVPISDLAAWHAECAPKRRKYSSMIVSAIGRPPGEDMEADFQYSVRSASSWAPGARNVTLHISAGIRDGHTGSVPIHHTLNAFNAVAELPERLTRDEIDHMTKKAELPDSLRDQAIPDDTYNRGEGSTSEMGGYKSSGKKLLFRRKSGKCTVSIFNGGHEIIIDAAFAWLEQFSREPPQRKIVIVGDSITQMASKKGGYIALLQNAFAGAEFVNAGRSGRKTTDYPEVVPIARKHGRTATDFFVFLGVNDLKNASRGQIDGCVTNMQRIIRVIRGHSNAMIHILTPTDIDPASMSDRNQVKGYNEKTRKGLIELDRRYRRLALENRIRYCGLFDAVSAGSHYDGLHLNEKGNRLVFERLKRYIEETLP